MESLDEVHETVTEPLPPMPGNMYVILSHIDSGFENPRHRCESQYSV